MKIPTILVNDGTVLDVVFTEWTCNESQTDWFVSEETRLPNETASQATHLVFELPIGCFMLEMGPAKRFDTIKPAGTGDRSLDMEKCTIPRKMRQRLISEGQEEKQTTKA